MGATTVAYSGRFWYLPGPVSTDEYQQLHPNVKISYNSVEQEQN